MEATRSFFNIYHVDSMETIFSAIVHGTEGPSLKKFTKHYTIRSVLIIAVSRKDVPWKSKSSPWLWDLYTQKNTQFSLKGLTLEVKRLYQIRRRPSPTRASKVSDHGRTPSSEQSETPSAMPSALK